MGWGGGRLKTWEEFLDEIQTKVLEVFLIAKFSLSTCTALPWDFSFFKLTQPLTVQLLYTPYRNLKSENSQDYAQKPQRNFTFMNSWNETRWLWQRPPRSSLPEARYARQGAGASMECVSPLPALKIGKEYKNKYRLCFMCNYKKTVLEDPTSS